MIVNVVYWLDDNANLIEVGFAKHNDYATELYKKEFGMEKFHDFICNQRKYPYQWLHGKGWIRITASETKVQILGDCIDLTVPMRMKNNNNHAPTILYH